MVKKLTIRFAAAVFLASAACSVVPQGGVIDDPALAAGLLVDVTEIDPTLVIDIKYATTDNFTKTAVYEDGRAFLLREAAYALARAQAVARGHGLRIKILDAYRPLAVQRRFFERVPDERYVANPKKGSRHNRGAAVDVTLVDWNGRELEMPTSFDDFTERASPGAPGVNPVAARNAYFLSRLMVDAGFSPLKTEWWHFELPGSAALPLLDVPAHAIAPKGGKPRRG